MEDTSGSPMTFASLSEADREIFYSVWARETAKNWAAKADQNPVFALTLEAEDRAVGKALAATAARGLSDYGTFAQKVNAELDASRPDLNRRIRELPLAKGVPRAISGSVAIKSAIMTNFKRGSVMTMSYPITGSGSGSSLFSGHATVLTDYVPEWQTNGGNDKDLFTMTSSWGVDTPWGSSFRGVAREPLGVWNNNIPGYSGAGTVARQWAIGRQVWIWNWFSSHFEWREASSTEYNSAAQFAVMQIGQPYNYLFNKNDMWWYYCSSLAWRSWKVIDSNGLDIDWSWWDAYVPPSDIEGSDKTVKIFEGQN